MNLLTAYGYQMEMKRIRVDALQPGDIVLTASKSATGKAIRTTTVAMVSHAMICVGYGSVIDSTGVGVQARNVQRELFKPLERVYAFRLKVPLGKERLNDVIDFARSQIGARYSAKEAVRSVLPGPRPRGRRQFCSRLVARSYAAAGVLLVADEDYCTPEQLGLSPLLRQLDDVTEIVSEEEIAAWRERPDPIAMTHAAQNEILDGVRKLAPNVEHFGDLDRIVREHPEWDLHIAGLFRTSGYLDLWRNDVAVNPWHYDVEALEAIVTEHNRADLRGFCRGIIAEAVSGGQRYRTMLEHHRQSHRLVPRQTTFQLVELYGQMVEKDAELRSTARTWLERHYPDDVAVYLER